MARYLVVGLSGGLGNQLFQYASGLGIARRLEADLRFEDSSLSEGERWLPVLLGPRYARASRLELLRVGELGVDPSDARAVDKSARELVRLGVDASRRVRRRTPRVLPTEHELSEVGHYDESLFAIDLPTILRGWFQTERYFEAVADDVVAHLRLPVVPLPPSLATDRPLVAVSFRRGDYVRFGWQLPFTYYERALARMTREVPGASFLVFGDDPEFVQLATGWVAQYGKATDAYEVTDGALEQLVLASMCDHAVIANSSFAWWAAWLGERRPGARPRLVLAPSAYPERFGPDVVPARWELVPTD